MTLSSHWVRSGPAGPSADSTDRGRRDGRAQCAARNGSPPVWATRTGLLWKSRWVRPDAT